MWWLIGGFAYLGIGILLAFWMVAPMVAIVTTADEFKRAGKNPELWRAALAIGFRVIVLWGFYLLAFLLAAIGSTARKTVWYFNKK